MKIANEIQLNAADYANQGNTALGIRGTGKTFGSMKAAEEIMDAGIPIIAFDPTGVWQNLRHGIDGNKGYPVVVAGGIYGDLRLRKDNAVQLAEAAMKAGVSLIYDLNGMDTASKTSQMHIVATTVDYLIRHNDKYGQRHVFLEEAAEWVPQRPYPGGQLVYSVIERLARMGRNFGLGYTLINQRAEEISKAVFELCELVLLFRQSGKNSLKSISDWLKYRGVANSMEIVNSLPSLKCGECWVVSDQYVQRANILPKKTFHPDPKLKITKVPSGSMAADSSGFISQMKELMAEKPAAKPTGKADTRVRDLEDKVTMLTAQTKKDAVIISSQNKAINVLRTSLNQVILLAENVIEKFNEIPAIENPAAGPSEHTNDADNYLLKHPLLKEVRDMKWIPDTSKQATTNAPVAAVNKEIGKCATEILMFLGSHPDKSFSHVQIAVVTDYSPKSGSFANSISKLNTLGLIEKSNGRIRVASTELAEQYVGPIPVFEYSVHTFTKGMGLCERTIYQLLLNDPRREFSKDDIASLTGYSKTSGSFANAISKLNTLELIDKSKGNIKLNPELLELMK